MRFIRTKDYGVCKVMGEDKNTLSYENSNVVGCLWKDSYKDQIQYADTIEELCDEFVLFYDNEATEPDLTYRGGFNDLYFQNELKHSTKIYGAIWTDKGLIYVAKMNDKGELELL